MREFVDESIEPVEFKSTWKRERSLASNESQTKEISLQDAATQSFKTFNQEVQSDLKDERYSLHTVNLDHQKLAAFLQKVEPMVMRYLGKNLKSRAFDDVSDLSEKTLDTVTCVHTLNSNDLNLQFQVTGLSWNSTGSTLAASYGRFDHEDWCTHKAAICTWNLDRRSVKEDKPDTFIDSSCCLMSLEFHPANPAWLAGGNFNGEVILWDLSREDDLVLATSGIGDESHREPVSKVYWITDQSPKMKNYNIVSVSGDGKILIWSIDLKKGKLRQLKSFLLMNKDLPRSMKVRGVRSDKEVGVTCISFSHEDPDLFVLGSESGCLFKCSLHSNESHKKSSDQAYSPVTFTFNPHHGPVHSVDCSKFHRHAFLSSGMDQSLRLYNMLQAPPVLIIEPGEGYIYSSKWSPTRPAIFAAVSEKGNLLIYDLHSGNMTPIHKLEASPNKVPVYSLQFNSQQKRILATGDGQGYIRVYRLPEKLTSLIVQDNEVLEEIMNTGSD
ncbi:cytoplasmic dynein 2 intermediate chain 2-like isoform X1 [Biomphalaria glabrata]|uniref:Cytoplasmic dynein 2 intermediate chain 2-like isoform X1 n=2 Tax=Biomphalaria glabrata TaxID=6526 RepID=A0A9W3ALN6_BIOGL|nr:cytoplasmic dynein 2 intermediate chain 2-like isoform X1 [Biomphalaria glabrata]XP_055888206.1 cytoplasmic dynein 2 intermediate chain 2-like isoform X1 [Biomphalaria glabrata]XP_055888210.1 cytoplasmic dynein 2 intermediate chain 2-like isoform X1 [Biomphalaria glabrata]XP_055888219.1 cytoplasmic dynein 2 intermediate chain 2-like isoform X1 [Biomphalaria glabrata]